MRRTRIVCTLGPATRTPEALEALIRAGMNVARLNFSHGDHATHGDTVRMLRAAAERVGRPVGILQDLCGPKIRLGDIPSRTVAAGETLVLGPGDVTYPHLAEDVPAGARILIDDGLVELRVEDIREDGLHCKVVVGGALSSRKGVNFPGVRLRVPAVTEKDWRDLDFGLEMGVDMVALSFVRRAEEVAEVRERVRGAATVIAKIEKFEALENLEDIVRAADGAMVARGDLGVETRLERVPLEQKRIIALCRAHARPVITATQMLDSMIRNPRPTRAEAADVANAVLDGTDAVMLSGETAVGVWPVDAVRTMGAICEEAEGAIPFERVMDLRETSDRNALSLAASEVAERLDARLIIACTRSGDTARRISQFRPRAPILAVTPDSRVVGRLQVHFGVVAVQIPEAATTDDVLKHARRAAFESGLAKAGDIAVIFAGRLATGDFGQLDVLGSATL